MNAEARDLHRPTDRDAVIAEVRRLSALGLRIADIAGLMRLHPTVVATITAGSSTDGTRRQDGAAGATNMER
jgi:hypothetical protein